jgi:Kef-type K+ transport system membrane component KefB
MTPLVLAAEAHPAVPVLLIIGLAIFFGTIGGRIFQRLHIPQVVGYIAIGLVAGRSLLGIIDADSVALLEPFNLFALGIIGFMIGGELRADVFKKRGREFFAILLAQGLGASVLVGLIVTAVAIAVGREPTEAVALGILFGAIGSATAPAATVNVLWEYKTRGVLTTAIFAIVALDDALALILYSVASSIAAALTGGGEAGVMPLLGRAAYELFGGVLLGAAIGVALNFVLRLARDPDKSLTFAIGAVLIIVGVARWIDVDMILAAMALGVTIANLAPRRSGRAFELVERLSPPIYVLFFVIVGAHLYLQGMPGWMWALAVPYMVGRTAGKMLGANLGARFAGAASVLRRYLGLSLFSQGGVAVGLSILAAGTFSGQIGTAVVMIVALTTFFMELIGPPCVKLAVKKAGEVGLDVTEEDLMRSLTVGDMVERASPAFAQHTPLRSILKTIAETDAMSYPVTDGAGELAGVITIQNLKSSFASEGLSDWLVAFDLMQPVPDTIAENAPLAEAMAKMREQDLDCLAVVAGRGDRRLVGVLEQRAVGRALSQEILRRRQLADGAPAQIGT